MARWVSRTRLEVEQLRRIGDVLRTGVRERIPGIAKSVFSATVAKLDALLTEQGTPAAP